MTKVFQWTLHKELWYWLAENPGKSKDQWPQWDFNGGTVDSVTMMCFACQYIKEHNTGCSQCPLVWSSELGCCGGYNDEAEYSQWENCGDPQERAELALTIAELPVKPGVVCV